MSQHFLLSAQARTLSIPQVMKLSDEQAHDLMKSLRWGDRDEDMVCPRCGTIFANHKLPIQLYLLAIIIFVNAVKGISALQLARDLGVQYKTAFVLAHKIRESLMEQRSNDTLTGEVHMDGAYVNHYIRPKNKKSERIDRRLAVNQRDDKRCVLVMRQGTEKTRTFVLKSENQASVMVLAQSNIDPDAFICADESNAYDPLHAKFKIGRVNHSVEYKSDDGIHNNYAESFFSRFRRMQLGQCHKFSNRYLDNYANEAAYREDMRTAANGDQFDDVAVKCLKTKASRDWCGYWQGNKRDGERLAA